MTRVSPYRTVGGCGGTQGGACSPLLSRTSQADYELSPDEKRKEMGEEIIRRFLQQEVSPGGRCAPRQLEQMG